MSPTLRNNSLPTTLITLNRSSWLQGKKHSKPKAVECSDPISSPKQRPERPDCDHHEGTNCNYTTKAFSIRKKHFSTPFHSLSLPWVALFNCFFELAAVDEIWNEFKAFFNFLRREWEKRAKWLRNVFIVDMPFAEGRELKGIFHVISTAW